MMLLKAILLAAATMVSFVLSFNVTTYCDTPAMTPEQLETHKDVTAKIAEKKRKGVLGITAADERPLIKVYVHVIVAGDNWDNDGWVKSFRFALAGVDYTVNPTWAMDLDEMGMKKALRKGTYQDLNLYYVNGFQRSGLAGYCTYPFADAAPGSDGYLRDGCTMNHDTMYGSPTSYEYNMGRVTVHEVGHWLGLRHTFEGGCVIHGDPLFTQDTNAEAEPAFGCPTGRDTCPDLPGLDPIGNPMDYTYE
ncbi:hypothetical protein N0V88_001534 [Collariella sp. IMI 366227]|nr:hypothetical protein N0V88_001534 [Collariella sp. IMI 366227]